MTVLWVCPNCGRQFARKNQRHHCGTGDGSVVLRGRPGELVKIFGRLEAFIKSLGAVEILARERYMLFRTTRIFADLTVMCDALRLAVHLPREARHRPFIKVATISTRLAQPRRPTTPWGSDFGTALKALAFMCSVYFELVSSWVTGSASLRVLPPFA